MSEKLLCSISLCLCKLSRMNYMSRKVIILEAYTFLFSISFVCNAEARWKNYVAQIKKIEKVQWRSFQGFGLIVEISRWSLYNLRLQRLAVNIRNWKICDSSKVFIRLKFFVNYSYSFFFDVIQNLNFIKKFLFFVWKLSGVVIHA